MLQSVCRLRAEGEVDAGEVWERYAVPSRWPDWAPHLTAVTSSTPRIQTGTRGRVRAVGVGSLPFEITAVDEAARTWSWVVHAGPVRLRLDHDVIATPRGSATGLAITGPAGVIHAYAPLAWWALRRLVGRVDL